MPASKHQYAILPGSGDNRTRLQEGFSLVELLIVVAIILVIVGIAIPNLLRSRQAANEASAISSIRTLTNSEIAYAAAYPEVGYTCDLKEMGPYTDYPSSSAAGYIDEVLAKGQKAWYLFSIENCTGTPRVTFFLKAVPVEGGGVRKFCSDQTALLRFDPGSGDCTAASALLQ